ncbi:MAG TPA: hypothetical protein DEP42_05090 [Ruminococcaceae bacterium]|mgnify:CR=1 FL=1|nr:hypothetical protein [Oscillospiraceae bacterium]
MDLRARYTLKIIQETFLTLLEKKSLDKITVSELCAVAQINRSTFYRHYRDVYAIVEKNVQQIIEEISKQMAQSSLPMAQQFERVFEILYQQKTFFLLLKRQSALKAISASFFRSFPFLSGNQEVGLPQYFTYYGFVGVFRYWLAHDMRESPTEISKQAFALFQKIN